MNDNPDGGKVVSLSSFKAKRDEPDPEFVRKDEFGRSLYCFTADYRFLSEHMPGETGIYSINFWAYSQADAEAKIAAMREGLTYKGQIYAAIPS